MERMENVMIAKKVYVKECASSHSVGRLKNKSIASGKGVWMSSNQG